MKNQIIKIVILVCFSIFATVYAQEGVPSCKNIPGQEYPKILPDNRVVFRVRAPEATSVVVDLNGRFPMTKDEDGVWHVTTPPVEIGFQYYSLIVNGLAVVDPATQTFHGMGRMASAVEIPEPGVNFWRTQNVPHGQVRQFL